MNEAIISKQSFEFENWNLFVVCNLKIYGH